MENTKKEQDGYKYYDIIVEEKTTGRMLGPMTTRECAEALGISARNVNLYCERGFYKNYKITSKINKIYRGKRPKAKDEEQKMENTEMKPTTVNESNANALKLCFEGLRIIENQYAQYGFADIATFIKWMYDNRWVEKAL